MKHEIPKAQWNTLRIVFKDMQFTVLFNGEQVFEAVDRALWNRGKTGVWTKADSVTYFDNFSVMGN